MPGLVGGIDFIDPAIFGLFDNSTDEGKFKFEKRDEDRFWRDGRIARAQGLIHLFRQSINKNLKALELLEIVMVDNQETIRIGQKNILIFGDLASYVIEIDLLLKSFTNIYSRRSRTGFREVEVHPRDRWIRNHSTACIQVDSELELPSIDTLIGLILGLKNDKVSFSQEDLKPLRNGLIDLYGFCNSPITEVLTDFLHNKYGAVNDMVNKEFRIKGTDGWTWHIEYGDPEIKGFRVSSSIRDGKKRLHFEDTQDTHPALWRRDIEETIDSFIKLPRELLDLERNEHLLNSARFFRESISEIWAPFRKKLENNTEIKWDDDEE